jgi:transglutaminase-like putative cysteine protease
MQIRIGYELEFSCTQTTPAILMLSVHHTRLADLATPDNMTTIPALPLRGYRDSFGNWCTRVDLPVGSTLIRADTIVRDSGRPDYVNLGAAQTPVHALPEETLQYLLGSRYCETEKLSEVAWSLFGQTQPGWQRVSAICDFVHRHLRFGYGYARPTKTAWEAYQEQSGVCRDFAHLAITLCRCMNIPARYCTGYLGDIGVPASDAPMDFSGWFEAYLDDWYTLDARHNVPRIGRVLVARGRDAADVAISTCFGPNSLTRFKVHTYEVGGTDFLPSYGAQLQGRTAALL